MPVNRPTEMAVLWTVKLYSYLDWYQCHITKISMVICTERPVRGVDHPPHLAPRLKKEYSYTSTPPMGLRGLF